MAGRPGDFDHSVLPPRSAAVIEPASTMLSYDGYLRVKSGISDSVLRMAGLPSAKELSYEAYVAALGGKAQPVQRPAPAQVSGTQASGPQVIRAQAIRTKAKQRISEALTRGSGVVRALVQGKRNVLVMSGAAMALLLTVFIGAAISKHIFGGNDTGAAEANVIPAQATGGPIALAVTQADELLISPIMTDLEQVTPLPTISVPNFTSLTDQPVQSTNTAEGSPAAASKTLSKSAEGGTKKAATTAPKTVTAKITKQPAKQVSVNTTKKNAVKAPKPAQVEVAQAGTKGPSPLRWLGQVFDDMSESLGGSDSSTNRKTRPKTPSVGDRETKR